MLVMVEVQVLLGRVHDMGEDRLAEVHTELSMLWALCVANAKCSHPTSMPGSTCVNKLMLTCIRITS